MAEFPNEQAAASYLAGLRVERTGLQAALTAAKRAKQAGRVSTLAARLEGVDQEIARVSEPAPPDPPPAASDQGERKDDGEQGGGGQ